MTKIIIIFRSDCCIIILRLYVGPTEMSKPTDKAIKLIVGKIEYIRNELFFTFKKPINKLDMIVSKKI